MRLSSEQLEEEQRKINDILKPCIGKLVSDLKAEYMGDFRNDSKASFVMLARKILGTTNNQIQLQVEFQPATLKTIRLTGDNHCAESMSFFDVNFDEWVTTSDWHQTRLYQYFHDTQFLFFIFQQYPAGRRVADNEIRLKNAIIWQLPEYDLGHGLKELWQRVCELINNNELEIVPRIQKSGRIIYSNNLPGITFNGLCHLRAGGANGQDRVTLPTGQQVTKQRVWLNAKYIEYMIK